MVCLAELNLELLAEQAVGVPRVKAVPRYPGGGAGPGRDRG